jgi:hypothetical protein
MPRGWRRCGLVATPIVFLGLVLIVWRYAAAIRPWLELLDGATWPTDWKTIYQQDGLYFSIVLTLRILLNLSLVPTVIVLGFEYFVQSRRRVVKLHQLLELREGAVLRAVMVGLDLEESQQEAVAKIASAAARSWDKNNLASIVGASTAKDLLQQEVGAPGRQSGRDASAPDMG